MFPKQILRDTSGCPDACWYIIGTVSQVLHNVHQTRDGVRSTHVAPAGLTQLLLDSTEHVQSSSLHIVYPDLSYGKALEETGLPTLHARAGAAVSRFRTISVYANDQFIDWFPTQRQSLQGRNLRNKYAITTPKCKTNRTLNSPIYYLAKTFE